jgi:hypothetical protein
MHPFPFIEELSSIERVTGIQDLLKIMDFVFTTVPWTTIPYETLITMEDIKPLYDKFKAKELGGWCGLNAEFFKWIIEGYRCLDSKNIRYRSYNHGVYGQQLTHIGVIVEVDRMEYYLDPYFNLYYTHKDGHPLQFEDLHYYIRERRVDRYQKTFLNSKKALINEDKSITYITPQEFLDIILKGFELLNLSATLKNIFNDTNPDLLLLLKIPD